jgi:hypothetical protein
MPSTRSPILPAALVAVTAIALVEALVIVFLLAGRDTSSSAANVPQPGGSTVAAQVTQAQPPTAAPNASDPDPATPQPPGDTGLPRGSVGEKVESGGFALTVLSVHNGPDADLANILDVREDERYIATEIALENMTGDSFFYAGSQFKLKDRNDFEYERTLDYRQPGFGSGTMVPGERVRGYLSFIVTKDASDLSLIFQPGTGDGYQTIYISLGQ